MEGYRALGSCGKHESLFGWLFWKIYDLDIDVVTLSTIHASVHIACIERTTRHIVQKIFQANNAVASGFIFPVERVGRHTGLKLSL